MATDGNEGASSSMAFKHFDVVSDASDHHYYNNNQSNKERHSFTNGSVNRKIMQEWKILESHLPDSIYVRVFETRIDLLRAVIIGASGTPYHDGLFFFDICFPPDYPNKPPQVWYHSHGLRLNPNLYANGMVCLSLINTWSGTKKEKWMPNKSTILQLLVSIQGLVLNDTPYFNEPGYEVAPDKRTPAVLQTSNDYNDNTFLLSCKTMLSKMRNPPKHFESFVAGHFQSRAKHILAAMEAYRSGSCLVGHYKDSPSSSKPYPVSAKLKTGIKNTYVELKVAFEKIEQVVQMAGNTGRENNVSQADVAATQSAAKIASGFAKPNAVVGKQKGSKGKGVWKKFTTALSSLFKL